MAEKTPLHLLSACRIQSLIKRDIVTVEEYARALLDHIKRRDPVIHAWAYLDYSRVLTQAKDLDKIRPADRGPLHGIVIGIKDVLLTNDMPTCYGSPIYQNEPAYGPDATVVAALRGAGALIMGKTHTTEFAATNVGGPCVNPYGTQRTPGGSSSGSAAAVADYQVPLAIGTQTGGSIIRPGAYCGIYALKPTWNTVSTEGMSHYSINLDTIGYFGRTADDLEYLAIFFGRIKVLPRALPSHLGDIRIGLLQTHVWPKAGQELKSIWDKIRVILTCEGATISDLALPMQFSSHEDYYAHVIASDAYSSFLGYALRSPHGLHRAIIATVSKGTEITPKALQKTYDGCAMLRSLWDAIADQYDIIITPSVPEEAPQGLEYTGDASFCSLWTLLHAPVVNVPGIFSKNGLPIGISIVGSRWNDDKVIWGSKVIAAILKRHSMAINVNQLQI